MKILHINERDIGGGAAKVAWDLHQAFGKTGHDSFMAVGDKRTIEIQPEDAYGPSREELVVEVPLNELPEHITPVLGQRLQVNQEGDQSVVVTITAMNEETVTLDANHPLAGRIIRFDVELVDVTPA